MRADVIREARRWLGTPYHHQAATLGAGCDCLGLIRGVWAAIYGAEPEQPPAYSPDWAEPQGDERLWQAACRHLREVPLSDAQTGDVLLFRLRDRAVAKHLGIQSATGDRPRMIHAYTGHGVIESPLSAPWARRIVARFRFPDLPHPQGD